MSLLLLFTGAGAAAVTPAAGWRGQFQTVVRRAGLTAAVVATLQPVYLERPPAAPDQYGVWTQTSRYNPAQRSTALLGQVSTWPAQTPAVGPPVDFDFFHRWQAPHIYRNNRARVVDLLGDVSANGWLRPQPEFDFFTRWQQPHIQRRKPYYENLGDTAVWSAQPPAAPFIPPPVARWQIPVATAKRALITPFGQVIFSPPAAVADQYGIAGLETWYYPRPRTILGQVTWAARVPDVTFTATPAELAHIRWQEPPARLRPLPRLQGFTAYAAEVPQTEYQDGWRSQFSTPPKQPARSPELLGWTVGSPQQAPPFFQVYQEGWRQEFSKPVKLQPQPRLEGAIVGGRVPDVEYQDGWRNKWQEPPANLSAKRSAKLLEGWSWPGYGYFFQAVVLTPTELWWGRWQDPPKAPPRSISLLDQVAWPPQVPTVEVVVTYSIVDLQHRYDPAKRAVELLGQSVTWGPRVADREYQDGWRNLWQGPPALLAPRRATNLLEAWDWPGYGYFFTIVAQTPTQVWWTRWLNPTLAARRSVDSLGQPIWPPNIPPAEVAAAQYGVWTQTDLYSPAKRSASLLGQVATWSPRVPDREFQEGWRSRFQDPPRHLKPLPRLQGQISLTPQVPPTPAAPPSEWWWSAYAQPLKIWQPWRRQGFVSFAAAQGLPAVAATPSALWMPSWQQWPRERLRSIYLRQSAWAAWDPQFIIQITPPTPLEGVTFTFGLKRGASATPGTKGGATMTGQRKVGGATLITRVKPRNS